MDDDTRTELDRLTLHSQADLHRMWQLLMRPLGFTRTSIWLSLIGPDRRPIKFLVEFDDLPASPSAQDAAALMEMLAELLSRDGAGCSVALLVTRPGGPSLTPADRTLAGHLVAAARLRGVPLEPLHVASDVAVVAVAPDDLAA